MVKFADNGQGYFDFDFDYMDDVDFKKFVCSLSFVELEKLVEYLTLKRNALLDQMKENNLTGLNWFLSDLHKIVLSLSSKLSIVLLEMTYKAWEV